MGYLADLGIVKRKNGKADGKIVQMFEGLFPDFRCITYDKPKDYLTYCWNAVKEEFVSDRPEARGMRGGLFEFALATLLVRENLVPFYKGVELNFVPNVRFDFILWVEEGSPGYPVCISAKTSLRERYKQADLEAMVLKNVHRKAITCLVTVDDDNACSNLQRKIGNGDVVAIDKCVHALHDELDVFIEELKVKKDKYGFGKCPSVNVARDYEVCVQ